MTADTTRGWHVITCEYPPQIGGVSDYTFTMASALAAGGASVHVWCPALAVPPTDAVGVTVHPTFQSFSLGALWRVGRQLGSFSSPRRLFVQWVPHGFGWHSLNLPFAGWLAWRSWVRRDELHLMVHEPFVPFSWRPLQLIGAIVHRAMLFLASAGATRVWLSMPSWHGIVRPYVPGRRPMQWLPLPAPLLDETNVDEQREAEQNNPEPAAPLVGHFGTYSPLVTRVLAPALDVVLARSNAEVILVGRDSRAFLDRFLQGRPQFAARVHATGELAQAELARQFDACDVMVQPYPDGISARRTSTIALLRRGRAVVTNGGALTESFWANGAVAFVPVSDGPQIGAAVVELLSDKAEQVRLSEEARRLYDSAFDIRHSIAALEEASGLLTPGIPEPIPSHR